MTDKVILSGIEIYAYGGVTEGERQIGQRYRVNVSLERDLLTAARSDSIEDTIHYGDVHSAVVETVRAQKFSLLESVAGRIADRLLAQFPVDRVTIRFEKLLPPLDGVVASAAVEITRERGSAATT
jgi:dihydroneopterin aldolase